jgi:indolepyruvate ferredoxin oxidoreductase
VPGFAVETSFSQVVAEKAAILAQQTRGGKKLSEAYVERMETLCTSMDLPSDLKADLALRAYDLIQFEDLSYARKYLEKVQQTYQHDDKENELAATRAVIWNLHKVMAIKDEVFVAHLLTSEEKRRRDILRFNIDPLKGDTLEYRHLNRPQFRLFGKDFAWDMVTRDWMLNLFKRMKWLRRALPEWHREEKDFRDWYLKIVGHFSETVTDSHSYEVFLKILRLPELVTGYREVRYPKMQSARQQGEIWLREILDPRSKSKSAFH